jgi:hypothetical protein
MTRGMHVTSNLIREFTYTTDVVESVVTEALSWVEPLMAQRRSALSTEYPWRQPRGKEPPR